MSGHSKWAQIKRKKAVTDAKRGAQWTKLIREITVAARAGGGSADFNPRLRLAIDTAKAANMPAENIERAIKKGTGELAGVSYEEIAYEGYGPGGVALYIETLTDNPNRTVADLRHAMSRNFGTMGTSGSVAWQFERKGQVVVSASATTEDALFEAALDAGADDVTRHGEEFVVTCSWSDFNAVQEGIRKRGIPVSSAELAWIAKTEVAVAGSDVRKLMRLLEAIEDLDDVQKVHMNADIDEAALAEAM